MYAMTLQEWCRAAYTHHTHPTSEMGAVSVIIDGNGSDLDSELWRLSDYRVTGRSGRVVWVIPSRNQWGTESGKPTGTGNPERDREDGTRGVHGANAQTGRAARKGAGTCDLGGEG